MRTHPRTPNSQLSICIQSFSHNIHSFMTPFLKCNMFGGNYPWKQCRERVNANFGVEWEVWNTLDCTPLHFPSPPNNLAPFKFNAGNGPSVSSLVWSLDGDEMILEGVVNSTPYNSTTATHFTWLRKNWWWWWTSLKSYECQWYHYPFFFFLFFFTNLEPEPESVSHR